MPDPRFKGVRLMPMHRLHIWINEPQHHQQKPRPDRHVLFLHDPEFDRIGLEMQDDYSRILYTRACLNLRQIVKLVKKQYPDRITIDEECLTSKPPELFKVPRPRPADKQLKWELINREMHCRKLRIAYWCWKRIAAQREEARLRREISWCQDN